jgi:hypothetical protein
VNPIISSAARLDEKLREGSAFLRRVLAGPKRWIIGGDDALVQALGALDDRQRSAARPSGKTRGAA